MAMFERARRLILLTGGHPFQRAAFLAMLPGAGWEVVALRHPAAETELPALSIDESDVLLCYDMPGYRFTPGAMETRPPSAAFQRAIRARAEAGCGMVLMHHALAGWPDWPEWAEIVGGRFLYRASTVRGRRCGDSGYLPAATYQAHVAGDHPVTAGLPMSFELTDELYLAEVFEDQVEPLLVTDFDLAAPGFCSAAAAVGLASSETWDRPQGSRLLAWTQVYRHARVVTLQPGDGPSAYANPCLRRLLAQALDWAGRS